MAKAIRYNRTSVKDFRVRVKIRGRWVEARELKNSFAVPKAATAYKILLKTRARSVTLYETSLQKRRRSAGYFIGKKRLIKSLQKRVPKPPKGEGAELVLDYLKRVLGKSFGLSSGMFPVSLYHSKSRFFTEAKELNKKWLYVRLWFAIESDGMSDGSTLPPGEKAWYLDSIGVNLPSPGFRLSHNLMVKYSVYINSILFNASDLQAEQGWVNRHNSDARFKKWAESAKFLGVEGDFRRTAAAAVKAKGFRTRVKVPKAKPPHRV